MRQYYTPLYSQVWRLYSSHIFGAYICAFLVTRLYLWVYITRLYLHVSTHALYLRVCICGFILCVCICAFVSTRVYLRIVFTRPYLQIHIKRLFYSYDVSTLYAWIDLRQFQMAGLGHRTAVLGMRCSNYPIRDQLFLL